jgi:hypothetical protein
VALIAAALAVSLILGTSFLPIQHFRPSISSLEHPAQPLTDDQALSLGAMTNASTSSVG